MKTLLTIALLTAANMTLSAQKDNDDLVSNIKRAFTVGERVNNGTKSVNIGDGKELWTITVNDQKNMAEWNVAGGNYSGITWLGNDQYAVVSDKEKADGYYPFTIKLEPNNASVMYVARGAFKSNPEAKTGSDGYSVRDCEGVTFVPSTNTLFISGEGDQQIKEYTLDGKLTGRSLAVPNNAGITAIYPNYGFEALTYNDVTKKFWSVTEHTLKADGERSSCANKTGCLLRVISFNQDLQAEAQYAYKTDAATAKKVGKQYAFGVPAMTALDDGSLLVLEREFYVDDKYVGSFVKCKIYRVMPSASTVVNPDTKLSNLPQTSFMAKELLAEFTTKLNIAHQNIANYEGMCLGPKLSDGRRTLILISDSQGNYGNSLYWLKDYVKVIAF